jgi:DNA-binding GntR family transcriptional regulator
MSEPASVRRIEAVSVVDRVTAELRRAIVTGAMRPGQEFSLRQIAGQLGISFIPVREALRTLEADGLLITRRGRSAVVAPLDLDGLMGISRLRALIEPDLGARSCLRIRPAELDRLEARIPSSDPPPGAAAESLQSHVNFHTELLRPAATTWDLKILDRLWQGAARYLYLGYARIGERWGRFPSPEQMQRELIAAFRTRDGELARAACKRKLDRDECIGRLSLDGHA